MVTSEQIDAFNRIAQVSRETIISLKEYENILIDANKKLNLIGKSTEKIIWQRHFLDSFQVIDFIDKNDSIIVDMGTGAGFPGLVLAIAAKDRKIPLKVKVIEKSPKKVIFLERLINKLKINAEAIQQNVFENKNKFKEEVFVARAFKPLKIILELMHKKSENFKKIFIFLGKRGSRELLEASKSWDIKYKQRMSITSNDSIIIEVNKMKKK